MSTNNNNEQPHADAGKYNITQIYIKKLTHLINTCKHKTSNTKLTKNEGKEQTKDNNNHHHMSFAEVARSVIGRLRAQHEMDSWAHQNV